MTSSTRKRVARALAVVATVLWSPLAMAADADRIEAAAAKEMVDKGQAMVIDVRGKEAYDAGHIEGSISVPLAEIDAHLAQLPKDKMIVAYCTCGAEASSMSAVNHLKTAGYTKVAALKGGLVAWQGAGGKMSSPGH